MRLGYIFRKHERGVSPVVGVILMVAITVLLAATVGTFVMNMEPPESQPPTGSWSATPNLSAGANDEITFTYEGGEGADYEAIYFVIDGASPNANGQYSWEDVGGDANTITASSSVTINASDVSASLDLTDATIDVVWRSPESDRTQQLMTWEE